LGSATAIVLYLEYDRNNGILSCRLGLKLTGPTASISSASQLHSGIANFTTTFGDTLQAKAFLAIVGSTPHEK
jgi:hypothetical protein